MPGILRRIPLEHGRRQFIVRGTVIEILPAKIASGFWKFFQKDKPATVRIIIDSEPYVKVQELLSGAIGGYGIAQTFGLGWNRPDPMPTQGSRVRITFCYAGEMETFFEGAPRLSFKEIELITDEREIKPDELVSAQPELFPTLT